jgi:hypothetical protein
VLTSGVSLSLCSYLEIYRSNPADGQWVLVHKTEVIKKTLGIIFFFITSTAPVLVDVSTHPRFSQIPHGGHSKSTHRSCAEATLTGRCCSRCLIGTPMAATTSSVTHR